MGQLKTLKFYKQKGVSPSDATTYLNEIYGTDLTVDEVKMAMENITE